MVFGIGGSYVGDVVGILHRLDWTIRTFVSNEDGCPNPNNLTPLVHVGRLSKELLEFPCVLGVSTPKHRRTAHESAQIAGFSSFPPVLDPTAVIAHDVTVDEGALVNAGVVVGAQAKLGSFSLINRSSSLGHGTAIGSFAVVGPGVTVCGDCRIASGAFVGAGAVLTPGSSVGADAFVGAGSVIRGEVPRGAKAVGSPARIRDR